MNGKAAMKVFGWGLLVLLAIGGVARAEKKTLDTYQVGISRVSKDSTILIKEFTTENADFGSAENPKKEKAREIADVMEKVAPSSFSEAFIERLTEAGVFPKVAEYEGGEFPEGTLLVEGEFTVINPGSRGKRYWVGMGAGKSKICIKGHVVDSVGEEKATFEHCRSGTMGWYGGRAEGMMTTDVYQTAFRLADFMAAWGAGNLSSRGSGD